MRAWHERSSGALLVGAVAVAGIGLNFTLLRLTQDAHDPVGKLSPRAVFLGLARTGTARLGDDDRHRRRLVARNRSGARAG